MDDATLVSSINERGLIELPDSDAEFYLRARNSLANLQAGEDRTFLATALRQLLSTYQQFANSAAAAKLKLVVPPGAQHPKLRAATELIVRLVQGELAEARAQGWVAKILIFTTYVGAERADHLPSSNDAHGTSAALKQTIDRALRGLDILARPLKKDRLRIKDHLSRALTRHGQHLTEAERKQLQRTLGKFSGTALAGYLLASAGNLRAEVRQLGASLERLGAIAPAESEAERRLSERRVRVYQGIIDRYRTRDLVARYDGAVPPEDRDAHLRGFNSPFQPLVLIASSVGQEGIDLQKYCRHVIHYDLEWNPAKLEQREGRVDREGRLATGKVNVYFLLCRGTYDERILHVMANRFRWHQVLLGNRSVMEAAPDSAVEHGLTPAMLRKMVLDLRPRRPGES
jgi:hypothetical protein